MNSRQIVRRLQAWKAGKPLPRGETMHFPVVEKKDLLILCFVRMGGESAPWGFACGRPGKKPLLVTVPEARSRDLVAEMSATLATALVPHFQPVDADGSLASGPDDKRPLRQIWLPNPTHVDMLHFLAYTYTFTKWGPATRAQLLNGLGRLSGWLFREAQRPGQITVMTGTDALREAYTFPAEDARQAHLGFLLAWLQARGGRAKRLKAAQEAERAPIATSLDPALERDELQPLLEQWNDARREKKPRVMKRLAREIDKALRPELLARYQLVEQTISVLRSDNRRTNSGVKLLEKEAATEHWYQYLRLERDIYDHVDGPAFIPSPETDRYAAAAASRYFIHEGSDDFRSLALVHDDREMQEEVIASGDGLAGPIVEVRDEGSGRRKIPVWVIETRDDIPLRVRPGTRLCVAGLGFRVVQVKSLERARPGVLRAEVQIIAGITRPRSDKDRKVPLSTDQSLAGQQVVLVPSPPTFISRLKNQKIWTRDHPGGWLTHASPKGPAAHLPDEVAEAKPEIRDGGRS